MAIYILKRLLILLPTLLLISIIVFFISISSPGDPALQAIEFQASEGEMMEYSSNSELLRKSREKLGLDQAAFYFSISTVSAPDSLYKIPFERERQLLQKLAYYSGQAATAKSYYLQLKKLPLDKYAFRLLGESDVNEIKSILASIPDSPQVKQLKNTFDSLLNRKTINNYIPKIQFHAMDNQYHSWLSGILLGDFGKSFRDGRSVATKIGEALRWTIGLSLAALFISYLLSILLAVSAVYFEGSAYSSFLSSFFLLLYSIPVFVVATLLLLLFGSSEYLQLLPVYGVGHIEDHMSWMQILGIRFQHLVLPIICLSYISISFLFQQLYANLKLNLNKEYILVAKAKGLSKLKVIGKHAFLNSLLPLIAHISNIFPAIVGGSFVVEFIFSIPGMGMLSLESIYARDYPTIFAILLLVSFVGLIGSLLSDILLAIVDPRINFAQSKKMVNV